MALFKEKVLPNGITLNYHRIQSVVITTNWSVIICTTSYINDEQRQKDINYQNVQKKFGKGIELTDEEQELLERGAEVYTESYTYDLEYDEDMSVKKAYEYLKTLDDFKDAKDV